MASASVPKKRPLEQCSFCDGAFPFVNILTCRELNGGGIPICMPCHMRYHTGCKAASSALSSEHYRCRVCNKNVGIIICALCSTEESTDAILDGVLMCKECSDEIHCDFKQHHSDHFYPVASRDVITVNGPAQCEDVLDMFLECAIKNKESIQKAPMASASVSRNLQKRKFGEASGVNPEAAGGSSAEIQTKK